MYSTVSLYRFLGSLNNVMCGNGISSLSNIDSDKSKFCPAPLGAWVPANVGTHSEPLYILLFTYVPPLRSQLQMPR